MLCYDPLESEMGQSPWCPQPPDWGPGLLLHRQCSKPIGLQAPLRRRPGDGRRKGHVPKMTPVIGVYHVILASTQTLQTLRTKKTVN